MLLTLLAEEKAEGRRAPCLHDAFVDDEPPIRVTRSALVSCEPYGPRAGESANTVPTALGWRQTQDALT